jgi:hypothetical protein
LKELVMRPGRTGARSTAGAGLEEDRAGRTAACSVRAGRTGCEANGNVVELGLSRLVGKDEGNDGGNNGGND